MPFSLQEEPYLSHSIADSHFKYKGYCIDFIDALVPVLGFQYEIHLVHDGNYGIEVDVNGTKVWNGLVGELINGVSIDIYVIPM